MRKLLIMVALLALAPAAIADVYKWVDRNGSVHYGDTRPANARSRPVDLRYARSVTTTEVNSCCVAKEDTSKPAEQPVYIVFAAEPPARNPAPRGMDFGVFIMLRHGMSEGELLQRAGPPDHQTLDGSVRRRASDPVSVNTTELIVKTFYYYPTLSNPFTTVITLTGGRITDLQRTRQF